MNWLANKETAASKLAVLDQFASGTMMGIHDYGVLAAFAGRPDVYDLIVGIHGSLVFVTSRKRLPRVEVPLYRADPSEVMRRPDRAGRNHAIWRGAHVGLDVKWNQHVLTVVLARRCIVEWIDEERGEVMQHDDVCYESKHQPTPVQFSPRLALPAILRGWYDISEEMAAEVRKMVP